MSLRTALPFGLALLATAPAASAGQTFQVCYSSDFPTTTTNWSLATTVPQFDPALGVLTGISVTFEGRIQGSIRFESLDASPSVVTSAYATEIRLLDFTMSPVVALLPSQNFVDNVAAFDGTIDFGGTSGVTHAGIDVTDSGGYMPTLTPAVLAAFVGNGTVPFGATAVGMSVVTGPGNVVSQVQTIAGARVTVCYAFAPDCNGNGIPDATDIQNGAADVYGVGPAGVVTCTPDGVPDVCQQVPDCDADGIPDACEILGGAVDLYGVGLLGGFTCAPDGVPDVCQPAPDCDNDGIPDACEIQAGAADVYGLGAAGAITCAPDGVPDVCQPVPDCDNDGIPDFCEIQAGAPDLDQNGVPDNCQPDCDNDGIPDAVEIAMGAADLYGPDTCAPDGIPDACQPEKDCDQDGLPNRCELAGNDCDGNRAPDDCQPDCDNDGVADACEILAGAADRYGPGTCSPDGVPDSCQPEADCDNDGLPDRCEVDSNGNGVPDDCEQGGTEGCTPGYWKNHLSAWGLTPYAPSMDFDTVFGVDAFNPNLTLGLAVRQGGGGINALGRHAVAALLSASHPNVDYPITAADVIALVQNALLTGQIEQTKDILAGFNELGCPL